VAHSVSEAAPGQCRAVKFLFNFGSPDNHLKREGLLGARKLFWLTVTSKIVTFPLPRAVERAQCSPLAQFRNALPLNISKLTSVPDNY
jgi:hypothetical protein